jgi:transposase
VTPEGALLRNASRQAQGDAGCRRIEQMNGTRRRRRWSSRDKATILAESLAPGANLSKVARRHGVNRGLLFTWRRQASLTDRVVSEPTVPRGPISDLPAFVPVVVATDEQRSEPSPLSSMKGGVIEVEINGAQIRLMGSVDAATLRIVIAAVRGTG